VKTLSAILLLTFALSTTTMAQKTDSSTTAPDLATLQKMTARFAPTDLTVDTSKLSPGDKKALAKLVQASHVIDDIFLAQYWSGNHALYAKLKKDVTPLGKARLDYFWINKSPWSALDGNKAFLPSELPLNTLHAVKVPKAELAKSDVAAFHDVVDVLRVPPEKLPGANFYPEDMTKDEFESWVKTLSPSDQKAAIGFFTVVVREPMTDKSEHEKGSAPVRMLGGPAKKGGLKLVPFSEAYKAQLELCEGLLREAASYTDNASLKKFLILRAEAFSSNDYYESDVAWMDLDAPIDVTIGPYETYNDEIFGYKASYESYINLRDDKESTKLAAFSKVLQQIENNLPIDAQYRNPKLGASAPIRVVNQVISGGDGNHGVQTAAYNLPNDERVVAEKGAKRVMLKNVQQAKFDKTLIPISKRVLAKDEQVLLSFDWFFTHILFHELSHGLGPHQITLNGQKTNPREQLKELYSAIEEAKADALGLWGLQYMIDHKAELGLAGVLPADTDAEKKLYTTYLASTFRTLRFGLHEAHGRGMALQLNYLLDKGGFTVLPDGTFAVDFTKIKPVVTELTRDLLMVEAKGDYASAKQLIDRASKLSPQFEKAISQMTDVPTDIRPIFVTANQLTATKPAVASKKK
jgi:hypothetical protein